MIPLTQPVIGMSVFFTENERWYKIIDIFPFYSGKYLIEVLCLRTKKSFWAEVYQFLIKDDHYDWLHEGF